MRRAGMVVAALVGSALWLLSPSPERGRTRAAAPEVIADGNESLRREVETLRAEVARGRMARDHGEAQIAASSTQEEDGDESPSGARRRPRADAPLPQADIADAFVGFEARHAEEPKDAQWSRGVETTIGGAFRGESLTGSTLVRADCRWTLCGVDVSHEDPAARDRFLQDVRNQPPFDTSAGAAQPTGDASSVVFLAREGHRLPPLDG